MLESAFAVVYTKFKLNFYRRVFGQFQSREATLTTVETFCMETIMALGRPTVQQFAQFVNISPPNAAYRINHLIRKGYLVKERSEEDKREYHLVVTQKYYDYYNLSTQYVYTVMEHIRCRFSPEQVQQLENMLAIISDELMPEIELARPSVPTAGQAE